MNLPDFVEICLVCEGKGEYTQTYNAGCGMGLYKSTGPCDFCKPKYKHGTTLGLGYIKKDKTPITESVENQIKIYIHNHP